MSTASVPCYGVAPCQPQTLRCGPILHGCIFCSPAGSQGVAVLRVCERLKYRLPDVTDHMHNAHCRQHLQMLNSSTVCAVSGGHEGEGTPAMPMQH